LTEGGDATRSVTVVAIGGHSDLVKPGPTVACATFDRRHLGEEARNLAYGDISGFERNGIVHVGDAALGQCDLVCDLGQSLSRPLTSSSKRM